MAKDDRLGQSLRALGTPAFSRLDGYDIRVDGVEARYTLGEEFRDLESGPYTVLRARLERELPDFILDIRPRDAPLRGGRVIDERNVVRVGEPDFDRAYIVEAVPASLVTVALDSASRAALLSMRPCYVRRADDFLELIKQGSCTEPAVVRDIVSFYATFRAAIRRWPAEATRGAANAGYRGADAQDFAIQLRRGTEALSTAKQERQRQRGIRLAKIAGLVAAAGIVVTLLERCP